MDASQLALPRSRGEAEIQKPGARDFNRCDLVIAGQCLQQRLRQRARIGFGGFGEQQRRIGGKITMTAVLRTLNHEIGPNTISRKYTGLAKSDNGLFNTHTQRSVQRGSHVKNRKQEKTAHCTRASGAD